MCAAPLLQGAGPHHPEGKTQQFASKVVSADEFFWQRQPPADWCSRNTGLSGRGYF